MQTPRRLRAAWLPALMSVAVAAHGSEAVRYRDERGIEIIGGRTTAMPAPVQAPASVPSAERAALARWQIAPHQQQARDRERLAILRQELATEVAAMDAQVRHARGLEAEPQQRAREQLRRHQLNIDALHAEIRRMTEP